MRYLLSLVLTLITLAVSAKEEYTVAFNFDVPKTLTPAIAPTDKDQYSISLEDPKAVFTAGPVKIYFTNPEATSQYPCLMKETANEETKSFVKLFYSHEMHIESAENASIKSIEIVADKMAYFKLLDGCAGVFSETSGWQCQDNADVHSVGIGVIYNPGPAISKIKVTYLSDDNPTPAPVVNSSYSIANGSTAKNVDNVDITFTGENLCAVELNDQSKVTLKDSKSKTFAVNIAKLSDLKYKVSFNELPSGNYTLNIEEGAFTQYHLGMPIEIPASVCIFTAQSSDFIYDYNDNMILSTKSHSEPITAEDFATNKFFFAFKISRTDGTTSIAQYEVKINESDYAKYGIEKIEPIEVFVDESKICAIQTILEDKIATGYLKKEIVNGKYTGYVLIDWIEKPTSAIHDGDYDFYIPAATYCDAAFGEYLTDKTTVDKSDCHVNNQWRLTLRLRKNATSISDINFNGRTQFQPSKFIENGKIVIIKGGKKFNVAGTVIE